MVELKWPLPKERLPSSFAYAEKGHNAFNRMLRSFFNDVGQNFVDSAVLLKKVIIGSCTANPTLAVVVTVPAEC